MTSDIDSFLRSSQVLLDEVRVSSIPDLFLVPHSNFTYHSALMRFSVWYFYCTSATCEKGDVKLSGEALAKGHGFCPGCQEKLGSF